jgi:hypothetical protein
MVQQIRELFLKVSNKVSLLSIISPMEEVKYSPRFGENSPNCDFKHPSFMQ